MTPILILFGIPPVAAVGSDLAFSGAIRAIGSVLHGRYSNIDFRPTGLILCGSVPASLASYFLLQSIKAFLAP